MFRFTTQDWSQHHVFESRFPRKQRILLKHVCGITINRIELAAGRADRSQRGLQQSGSEIQDRRFSAAGGSHEGHKLAPGHLKRKVSEGGIGTEGDGN